MASVNNSGLDSLEGDKDNIDHSSSEEGDINEYNSLPKKVNSEQSPNNQLTKKNLQKIVNGSMNIFSKESSNSLKSLHSIDAQEEEKENKEINQNDGTPKSKKSHIVVRSVSYDSAIKTQMDEDDSEEEEFQDEEQRKRSLFSTVGSFKKLEEPLTHEQHLMRYTEKFNLGSDFAELMKGLEKSLQKIRKIIINSHKYEDIFDLEEEIEGVFTEELIETEAVAIMYNTKKGRLIKVPQSQAGRFVVAFNPIDVNKLEDVCLNCGLSFVIMKKISSSYKPANESDFYQSGEKIDCAGFCLFGKYTTLVYHAGFRVNTYIYNKKIKVFELKFNNIKTPKRKGLMSFNAAEIDLFDKNLKLFLTRKIKTANSMDSFYLRYSGSFIADFYRTLLFGGIMLLPVYDGKPNEGGLNIFEAFTFSYLIEKAWERSSCGADGSVIYKKAQALDTRISLYLGYGIEVQELENIYLEIRRQNSVFEALKKKQAA